MKVLITGAGGQVGRALLANAPTGIECVALGREQLDLQDNSAISDVIARVRPSAVINAAAYTAVDKAEGDRESAFAINAEAVGVIAKACRANEARLIHVSTDFVFAGASHRPYRPDDETGPLNTYGASKREGELRVTAIDGLRWLIFRTAWVYASKGSNFLLTMLRLFRERDKVSVVCDQVGTPTSANTLARVLWRAVGDSGSSEILHYTDAGVASWYDFAVAIYEEARASGLINRTVQIVPIATTEYPTPARRPAFSVLDKSRAHQRLGIEVVHWRAALREVIKELQQ
jgi:dTDP-4-dehydrorhamnose reductase